MSDTGNTNPADVQPTEAPTQPSEPISATPAPEPAAAPAAAPAPSEGSTASVAPSGTAASDSGRDAELARLQAENERLRQQVANPNTARGSSERRADRVYVVPNGVTTWGELMESFDNDIRNADGAPDDLGNADDLLAYNRQDLEAQAAARGFSHNVRFPATSDGETEARNDYTVFPGEVIRY